MAKAVVPTEIPALPEGMIAWSRSTRGRGGMFHAHALGWTACANIRPLDRHHSEQVRDIGDMQYWGVCPRCYAKVPPVDAR